MQTTSRLSWTPAPAWLLVIAMVAALAIVAAIAAGGRRAPVPAPFGLARPGLVAFEMSGDVIVANADGSARRSLTNGSATDTFPMFSPDGKRLAYWRQGTSGLVVVVGDLEAGSWVTVPLPAGATPGSPAEQLEWSPGSDRLLFAIAIAPSATPNIWTLRADGGDLHALGDPGVYADEPTWSPDGRQIMYHGGGEGPDNGVYVMRADGTGSKRILTAAGSGFAFNMSTWRPQGDLIAFYAGADGAHDVYVIHPDGTGQRNISADHLNGRPTDEYWPAWSPDGTRLAFTQNVVRDQTQPFYDVVVVVDPDGSNAVTLDPVRAFSLRPESRLDRSKPIWSPDGKAIAGYLFNETRGDYAIITFDVRDGRVLSQVDSAGGGGLVSWQRLAP